MHGRPASETLRAMRTPPQSLAQIFALPLLFALLSFAGLIVGLTGEGWRDGAATILLLLPLAAFAHHWRRRG